jgi:hypothetical protein
MENIRLPDGFRSKKRNADAKRHLTKETEVDKFAKALAHYAFRNGPVEDIHGFPEMAEFTWLIWLTRIRNGKIRRYGIRVAK